MAALCRDAATPRFMVPMRSHFRIGGFPCALTKLSVRTNATGTVQFDDPGATNRPARFYRVVVP
jgi:hypothetical protein